jgi:gas vesicle protein
MRYLLAALGGAAIGAGAALLFAPQSGRATRATIRDKTTKCTNEFQEFAKGKTEHLRNKMKGARHEVESAIDKGRELIGRSSESVNETTSEMMDDDSIYATSTV